MSEQDPEYVEPTPPDPDREIPRPEPIVSSDGDLETGPEPSDEAQRLAAEHAGEFDDIEGETGDVN